MADSVIGSKEILIGIIALVLANLKTITGIEFPVPPEMIYAAGIALMGIVRVFFTEGKIDSILPKTGILAIGKEE
jgi:hypothetical protein